MNPVTARRDLVERLLGGPRTLRRREVARAVGISLLSARKLWRALGFPGVGDEVVAFTDADRDALERTVQMVRDGVLDEDTTIAMARALGQSTDRLVSWQMEALMEHLARQAATGARVHPVDVVDRLVDDFEKLLVYSWRRQMAAAVNRLSDSPESGAELTVGFADLVSYTRLSQRLEQRELSVLVQRFEGLAADVVTTGGGRVVKTVGDEVLFTAEDPVAAAVIALSISERMAVDDVVPDVRIGISHGPVLRSLGDVYGPTVNLASRLTALAQPGTVITDPRTGQALQDHPGILLVAQRRRQVRGFGILQPLLVAPAGPTSQLITVD
jgi:adenylate cyclase